MRAILPRLLLLKKKERSSDRADGEAGIDQQRGIEINSRDEALRALAEYNLKRPEWQHFYDPQLQTTQRQIAGNGLGQLERCSPVMTIERKMGNAREFDEAQRYLQRTSRVGEVSSLIPERLARSASSQHTEK